MSTFGERIAPGFHSRYEGELLHSERSQFQKVDVYDHSYFGRVLVLDDLVQTTTQDEFCYHEMLVHPVLASLAEPRRVLIIGGGDGGTLRHVLMHSPDDVTMCEIDATVIRTSRELLPSVSSGAFDDPRASVVIGDGAAFVREHEGSFDAIIVDGSDAVGPAAVLFSEEFYASSRRALRDGGVFVSQTGSPMFQEDEFRMAFGNLSSAFGTVEPYLGFVPTYPGALWSYMVATTGDPVSGVPADILRSRLNERDIATKYYTPDLHAGAFALPPFVRELCATTTVTALPRG